MSGPRYLAKRVQVTASSSPDGLVLKARVCWSHGNILCCPLSSAYKVLFPIIYLGQAKRYGVLEMYGESLPPAIYSGPYHHEEIEAASQRTARSLCAYCPLNGERQTGDCLCLVCNLLTWKGRAPWQHLVFSMFPGPRPG